MNWMRFWQNDEKAKAKRFDPEELLAHIREERETRESGMRMWANNLAARIERRLAEGKYRVVEYRHNDPPILRIGFWLWQMRGANKYLSEALRDRKLKLITFEDDAFFCDIEVRLITDESEQQS